MSRSTPRMSTGTSSASSTGGRPEAEALPGLVELGRERPVHVEVARLDRQVVRLERSAALLVDDVERADEPDVVEEVGEVARPPAAVEVADEGRPADGPEDEVAATEDDVPLRVPGVEVNSDGARATSASTWAGSSRTVRVERSTIAPAARERIERAVAEAPRPRSRPGSAATLDGSPRPGRRTGSRAAGTG